MAPSERRIRIKHCGVFVRRFPPAIAWGRSGVDQLRRRTRAALVRLFPDLPVAAKTHRCRRPGVAPAPDLEEAPDGRPQGAPAEPRGSLHSLFPRSGRLCAFLRHFRQSQFVRSLQAESSLSLRAAPEPARRRIRAVFWAFAARLRYVL